MPGLQMADELHMMSLLAAAGARQCVCKPVWVLEQGCVKVAKLLL